jgi:hypothetical protein
MNAFIMVVNDVDLDEPMVEEKRKVTSAVINEEICKVNRSNKGISKHNLEADKKWRNQ